MNHKQLSVRLYGEPVGILQQDSDGDMNFRYNHNAQQPLSISMPIREEAFTKNNCEAFFGGLLPESDSARQAIANRYRISPNNSFALLKAIGYDCAGAISLHEVMVILVLKK